MAITAGQVKELREKTGVGMMDCKKALTDANGDLEQAVVLLRERGMSRAAKKASRAAAEGKVSVAVNATGDTGVILEINCETDFAAKNEDFSSYVAEVTAIALDNKVPSLNALREMPTKNGKTVADALTDLIAKVGENMNLRRVEILTGDKVACYDHMGGKIGTLVAIDGGSDDEVANAAKDVAMHIAAAAPKYLKSDEVDTSELDQEKEIARKKLEEEGKPAELIEKILIGQMSKFYKEVCLVDQSFVKDPSQSVSKFLKSTGKPLAVKGFLRFQLGDGVEKKEDNFAEEVAAAVKGNS